jgi:uncharacterized protein YyaL (SSP411 family)
MPNRLAGESSPYLLQHQENPVDWYPWGDEAFEVARREDKPIFLSIGYAACHWCHVMAHESFESEETAKLMNELFVNVKVDREERPDVDAVYMNAIHVMGEGGGWPLSAFCDPDGKPYFLGTYFPPEDRFGRPGFPEVLRVMAKVFAEQRDKVEEQTNAVIDGLRHIDEHLRKQAAGGKVSALEPQLLIAAGRRLAQRTDPHNGGFGTKPKFPSSSSHDLLGRMSRHKFGKPAREAFLLQASKMAKGGIYDHLGGGFARYSVDERWLVPHFEKMLYDNAQLLSIFGEAFALTGDDDYLRVIRETIDWLTREMQHDSGGLYASQDADSEGVEGKYYVWLAKEIKEVLGAADAIQFNRAYAVTERGNFEHGTTVLERVTDIGSEPEEAALRDMREKLFAHRDKRIHPETDTKILASWNGLMVSGLIRAWERTGHAAALELAKAVAEFLDREMVHDDGRRVWRIYKDGVAKLDGTLDDYAFVGHAFLMLGQALEQQAWWDKGATLIEMALERFYEDRDGVGTFYMTPHEEADALVHRPESHNDGAIPSGAAVATECLLMLGLVADNKRALDVAERYLAGRAAFLAEQPYMGARFLSALDLYLHCVQLVLTDGEGRDALLEAARKSHAPSLLIAGSWASASIRDGKTNAADGKSQAYVCRGQSCSAPVTDPADVAPLLTP